MQKHVLPIVCLLALCAPAFAGITVTNPTNDGTYAGSVPFAATATTSCQQGIASMGIYTAPGVLSYVVNGATLNTSLTLSPGTYNTTLEAWDHCGAAFTSGKTVTVTAGGSGVTVTAPANNSTVTSPVNFVATATTSCNKGVASMGIYTAPGQLAYVVNGASLNTSLTLSNGTYKTTVEEWDKCGGAATTPITITVSGSGGGGTGKSFSALQHSGGWAGYGQGPPKFIDCSPSPCDGATFWMAQNIKSPSMSGESSEFDLGGSVDYMDTLWNNHLIGTDSSQGINDSNHTLVPTLTTFTYDVYFYGSNLNLSQALEFDINQFYDSMGFIFGHECRIAGGNEWDVWDNASSKWIATGIACNPVENSWNHLTIKVQRTSSDQLMYQSITLNGYTANLNWTYGHGSCPSSWWGVTINYQMDGNYKQQAYNVYLDDLTFTYE